VQTLFDGKDLTGWDGDRNIWSVLAGAITRQNAELNPLQGKPFLFWQGSIQGHPNQAAAVDEVRSFSPHEQHDDVTMIIARRLSVKRNY
jgi:hypothetical protein